MLKSHQPFCLELIDPFLSKSELELLPIYSSFTSRIGLKKVRCTNNVRVPMVFIVFSSDSWESKSININYIRRAYVEISHRGTLVGVHPTIS